MGIDSVNCAVSKRSLGLALLSDGDRGDMQVFGTKTKTIRKAMNFLQRERDKWIYNGVVKPPFYIQPQPGQVSVWDFPRPPSVIVDNRKVEIFYKSKLILSSNESIKICETASPPTWYFSRDGLAVKLEKVPGKSSGCEWKGMASYYSLDGVIVGWSYESPNPEFAQIKGMVSFYASKVDCFVDGKKVVPQPSDFYGGWVTEEVIGPFKGDPGISDLTK